MKLRYRRGPRTCYRHTCEECQPEPGLSDLDNAAIREMRDLIARIEGGEVGVCHSVYVVNRKGEGRDRLTVYASPQ